MKKLSSLHKILWLLLFLLAFDITAAAREFEPDTVVHGADISENRFMEKSSGRSIQGKDFTVQWRHLKPGTETKLEDLKNERFVFVRRGTAKIYVDGSFLPIYEKDIFYQPKGSKTALVGDRNTAEIFEFSWNENSGKKISAPTVPPNKVINYNYLQWLEADDGTLVRLLQGTRGQVSFVRVAPNKTLPPEPHPEERIFIVLRGSLEITVDGTTSVMIENDVIRLLPDTACAVTAGRDGCEILAVNSPARPSYTAALMHRIGTFHSIIPKFAKPELVVDGRFGDPLLSFSEGPNWINGRLYFTEVGHGHVFSVGTEGDLEVVNSDLLPNGTALMTNGNIAVCNLKGRTVVEMTPDGKVTGTLADSYDGIPFGGNPNDVICDSKGGLYFTIMSFRKQEGANILYYRTPHGDIVRVTEPGEFGIPNGCVLSLDGTQLYVNDDQRDHLVVYDINADGTLANGRPFAKLIIHETVLGNERTKSFADGMTIDTEGNFYVCASGFVQIFDSSGSYRGGLTFPKSAFHCAFGGPDNSTLYVTCMNQVYKIETLMTGVRSHQQ